MPKRHLVPVLLGLLAVAVIAGWAFTTFSWVPATVVVIGCLTALAVVALAADWEQHPDFAAREEARARRRLEKWERGAEARAKDRARWEAHRARRTRQAQERETGR